MGPRVSHKSKVGFENVAHDTPALVVDWGKLQSSRPNNVDQLAQPSLNTISSTIQQNTLCRGSVNLKIWKIFLSLWPASLLFIVWKDDVRSSTYDRRRSWGFSGSFRRIIRDTFPDQSTRQFLSPFIQGSKESIGFVYENHWTNLSKQKMNQKKIIEFSRSSIKQREKSVTALFVVRPFFSMSDNLSLWITLERQKWVHSLEFFAISVIWSPRRPSPKG